MSYISKGSNVSRRVRQAFALMGTASALTLALADGALAQPVEDVVVTGSRIRGVAPVGSPLIQVGQDDFRKSGATTTHDLLRTIPQVSIFGSGEATANGGAHIANSVTNFNFVNSVNLRGLNPTATLTLMNGMRLASTGFGQITDLDKIPGAAVERVEVVADGASAIYGADAVAGVVNVVLRKPFDGVETTGRVGFADGRNYWLASQVLGTTWDEASNGLGEGGLIIAYQHKYQEGLHAEDRPNLYNDDLTPWGGAPFGIQSMPANVTGLVGPAGTTALYAVPAGIAAGQGVTLAQLGAANAPNRTSAWWNTMPVPKTKRDNVAVNFHQELMDWLSFDAHGIFSDYWTTASNAASGPQNAHTLTVPPTNPFSPCNPAANQANTRGLVCPPASVGPFGPIAAGTITVPYNSTNELGAARREGPTQAYQYGGTFTVSLPYEWKGTVSGNVGREYNKVLNGPFLNNTAALSQALGRFDKPANVPFFNPFCDSTNGPCNSAITNDYIRSYEFLTSTNTMHTFNASVDGAIFDLPAGQVRLAAGVEYLWQSMRLRNGDNSGGRLPFGSVGVYVNTTDSYKSRTVHSYYGELYVPIVGEANAMPGIEKLEVTVAGRVENYSDIGKTSNPKLGLNWSPIGELDVHASYGTSFRAPTLRDVDCCGSAGFLTQNALPRAQFNGIVGPVGSGNLGALAWIGGTSNIQPENARTWTVGADWTPEAVPGLTLGVTYYKIKYVNNITLAAYNTGFIGAVNTGIYEDFLVFNPTYFPTRARVNQLAIDLGYVPGLVLGAPLTQAQFDALRVGATTDTARGRAVLGQVPSNPLAYIMDARAHNSGSVLTNGFDFTGRYDWEMDWANAHLGFVGTYVNSYEVATVPGAPLVEQVNTFGYPLRFSTRVEAGLEKDGWSGTVFVNYTNSYDIDPAFTLVGAPKTVSAYTTVDLNLGYDTGTEIGMPLLRNVALQVNIQNLFDEQPPLMVNSGNPPPVLYDQQYANPIGRLISLGITKRW